MRGAVDLSEDREWIALDHDLHDLVLGRASVGSPALHRDRSGAHATLAMAPVGDDLDVVTLLERPPETLLEVGIRPTDDHAHHGDVVHRPPRRGEDAHD